MEKTHEILDLPEPVRALVGECELTGRRTYFTRNARPVVALVSYDEYLALRETIEVANDDALRAQLAHADASSAEFILQPSSVILARVRFTERFERDWQALSSEERAAALEALQRIDEDPIAGAPLFEPLRGIWSFRAGHLRILYRIVAEARFVLVMSIGRAAA